MNIDYTIIIASIINFVLLFVILITIYKGIKWCKNFIIRNKEIDKKLDIILKKLDNKDSDKI
jgi:F0F1-type ATP synthase membrane subunit b/b'